MLFNFGDIHFEQSICADFSTLVATLSKKKTSGPTNRAVGRARSLEVRQQAAKAHDQIVWDWLWIIAVHGEPKKLQDFADALNQQAVRTRRGGSWTPELVHAHLKKHGVSAKQFINRVTQPSPFEKRPDFPSEVYAQWGRAVESIGKPSELTGTWNPATRVEPKPSDLIRHTSEEHHVICGEGQLVRALSTSRYLCWFVGENGTYEVECSASEIEVFKYRLSREERIAAIERISSRLLDRRTIHQS